MNSWNQSGTSTLTRPISAKEKIARGAAALAIGGMMTLTALASGQSSARAQTTSVGTAGAAIAPATSVAYLGLSLDTTSAQWGIADGLLAKLGVENGATGLLDSMTSDMNAGGTEIDSSALLGGELAIVITNLDSASSETSTLTSMVGGLDLPTTGSDSDTGTPVTGAAADTASGTVLVLKPTDVDAAAKAVGDAVASGAAANGVQVTQTTYNGVTINAYPGDEASGTTGEAYAVNDGFVIWSETAADLEPILDTAAGTNKPLSSLESFQKADAALAGERLGFGFMNGTAIAADQSSLDAETASLVTAFSGLLGLDRVTGLSVVADPAGLRFNTVEIRTPSLPIDAKGTASDLDLASKIPSNALIYANGYDIGQGSLLQGMALYLVTALSSATNPSPDNGTPAAQTSADALFENAKQLLGFNLKTDFIEQMVGQYVFALWNVDPNDMASIGGILASKVKDPAIVSDALSKLSLLIQAGSQGSANVTTISINNSAVSHVVIGDGTSSTDISFDYGVVGDQFMLGLNDSLNQYINGPDSSLADSPDYKAALSALPTEYDGIFYMDLQQAMALSTTYSSSLDMGSTLDNDADCGNYSTQPEAQAAYDADSITNYDLDMDFDGVACEDFFSAATPEATPAATSQYPALKSFALVSYKKDGLSYTSSILVINDNN